MRYILFVVAIFAISCQAPRSITAIGDSTIAGIGINRDKIVQVFNASDFFPDIDNQGVSGSPIDYWTPIVEGKSYDILIISIGFNSAKNRGLSVADIGALYKELAEGIVAREVFVIGIYPIDHHKSDTWYPEGAWISNTRLWQVNQRIADICYQYGFTFIDPFDYHCAFIDSFDGIHPSRHTFEVIAREIKARF